MPKRPHLVTEAIAAIQHLGREGETVHPSAVALLVILCDRVHASHGQWYGSWEKLASEYPWSRRWFNKWRSELERLGLIANRGLLPGRKLNTWQLLPWRYPLVGTDVHTSVLVSPSVPTSGEGEANASVGTPVPGQWEQPFNPLMGTIASSLVGTDGDTNTRTPIEHLNKHPSYDAGFAGDSIGQSFDEEDFEANRRKTLAALAEYEKSIDEAAS